MKSPVTGQVPDTAYQFLANSGDISRTMAVTPRLGSKHDRLCFGSQHCQNGVNVGPTAELSLDNRNEPDTCTTKHLSVDPSSRAAFTTMDATLDLWKPNHNLGGGIHSSLFLANSCALEGLGKRTARQRINGFEEHKELAAVGRIKTIRPTICSYPSEHLNPSWFLTCRVLQWSPQKS